jgi:uncharacterized membrane protein
MRTNVPEDRVTTSTINVGPAERVGSVVLGSALLAFGLMRRSRAGLGLAATGGMMLYRGLGGHCLLYRTLGVTRTASGDEPVGQLGVKLEREVHVDEQPDKVYAFWRDLRNLPIMMPNLDSVQVLSAGRSGGGVKGAAGSTFEWTAEIINDQPNELIAWETEPGARVAHAGSVNFIPRPGGGTIVRVSLQYDPPGGELIHMLSRMFGLDPTHRIDEDLERLREAFGRASQDRDGLQSASADALGLPAAKAQDAPEPSGH